MEATILGRRADGNFSFRRLCLELREKILRPLDLDYDFIVDETKELIKRDWYIGIEKMV